MTRTWSLDGVREDFMHDVYNTLDFLPTNDEANRIIDSFDRVTSGVVSADVLDKIRAEIVDTLYVDSLIFGELIDYREEKISTDDVIEEFNRVTRAEVLKIIDKYRAKKEGEK